MGNDLDHISHDVVQLAQLYNLRVLTSIRMLDRMLVQLGISAESETKRFEDGMRRRAQLQGYQAEYQIDQERLLLMIRKQKADERGTLISSQHPSCVR